MRVSEAKATILELVSEYFANCHAVFSNQSRMAQPNIPLVLLTQGKVTRGNFANDDYVDGVQVSSYPSAMSITIDIFTNGVQVMHQGAVIGYEDNSADELAAFSNFLRSEYANEWLNRHEMAVLIEGDITPLSGLVSDTVYEYRSRMELLVSFVEKAVGHAGILPEKSIKYPVGLGDAPEYSSMRPVPEHSVYPRDGAGPIMDIAAILEDNAIVVPEFTPTVTGGGTQKLAGLVTGYFEKNEIKEE